MNNEDLEAEFHRAMISIYEQAKEFDFFANRFKQMLDEYKGMETAKRLMEKPGIQSGLMRLWEEGRLDLSVECLMLKKRFESLFSEKERKEAENRLTQLGFGGKCN